ncbi:hypothetical protein ABMA27_013857 [Loxostege sticticalis]|uniref:Serine protease K12H4.7 n=1 Tax=Loxostege sticticalis TaxID=481309 RepID=A0ABR3IBU3_LOXSC
MIYLKTLSLWVLALSVHNCYGFFRFDYNKYLKMKKLDTAGGGLNASTLWIDQPLDHFNPTDTRTWKMRYLENLSFYQSGGPILLFIGGEGPVQEGWLEFGLMASFASEVNGAMYQSEHRFYGASIPNDDISVENLAYLSSAQALADIKNLIEFLKSQTQFSNSKVVVFGGSYAGNLAAWLRLLYPDLIDAAVSSSGPVLAKTDYYEYLEVVGSAIKNYGTPDCYDKVAQVFRRYEELLKTADGIEQLKQEESVCDGVDLNVLENQYVFFLAKIAGWAVAVQYGDPDHIRDFCSKNMDGMKEHTLDDIFYNTWNRELRCSNYDFNMMIEGLQNSKDSKPWIYQTCTEFGYKMTTTSDNQPFTHLPLDFYIKMCTGVFGPEFDQRRIDEGVSKTNDKYGGLTPNVEKVVFVQGEIDPWHKLGVLKDLSNEAPARMIPRASHCSDLMSDDANDMPERVAVRNFEKQKLKEWIGM